MSVGGKVAPQDINTVVIVLDARKPQENELNDEHLNAQIQRCKAIHVRARILEIPVHVSVLWGEVHFVVCVLIRNE